MTNTAFEKRIICIGAGYVGGPTMAMIAAKCPRYEVTIVDINAERIAAWQTDELPIYEPGLLEVVKKCRGRNLFFSTDIAANIDKADIVFVCVNTPTKTFGEGAGKASDLQYIEKTARDIVKASKSGKIIVEKSTIPVRTAETMERILNTNERGFSFEVISNPEFLAEGSAMADLENPDRVLIGSQETESGLRARDEIVRMYAHWVPRERIITSNLWSSELSKLVANAFLAQRISSINSISSLCEVTDANISEVAHAIGMDSRIGPKFLQASVGFGGSCFKKDILNLVYICEHFGLAEAAGYWESVVLTNEHQKRRFVTTMVKTMFNTVSNKRIALFGFAFKANTGDTRESPAIDVTRYLMNEQANVVITDPQALACARSDLQEYGERISYTADPYEAAAGAHAIAIMTEWDDYKKLDYKKIYSRMEKPAFIFDGRNILNHRELFDLGFNVFAIGRAPLKHF